METEFPCVLYSKETKLYTEDYINTTKRLHHTQAEMYIIYRRMEEQH